MAVKSPNKINPGRKHIAITKSDVTTYSGLVALFVGGAGNVVIVDSEGTSVTYAVAAGAIIPFEAVKVSATTTATGIVGWFQ